VESVKCLLSRLGYSGTLVSGSQESPTRKFAGESGAKTLQIQELRRMVEDGFNLFLKSRESDVVLGAFENAFIFRRSLSSQAESGAEGLRFALRNALFGYPDPDRYPVEMPPREMHVNPPVFRTDVEKTFRELMKDDREISRFVSQLGKDPSEMDAERFQLEFEAALVEYYHRKEEGLSRFPLP
jgi:hypothetical protein